MTSPKDKVPFWLGKLTKLNPASAKQGHSGTAPHKPLLLLSILDMVEAGELPSRTFARTAGMVLRFRNYGSIVADRWPTRLDLRMPFYYLKSQDFWTVHEADRATRQFARIGRFLRNAPGILRASRQSEFSVEGQDGIDPEILSTG